MYEKVNPAHPDKVADRIAGTLVDLAYKAESDPRIAVEVLIGHGVCHIIAETSVHLNLVQITDAVRRIAGNLVVDYTEVMQDAHLSANQRDGFRCGDNGIFKGAPVTSEQDRLAQIARDVYTRYGRDGKYILDGSRLILCQSNAPTDELRELYPGAEGSICRTAEILRREEGCWRELGERGLPEKGTEMERRVLLELPYALRLRALRTLVERTAVGRKDYGAAHYEAMERLLHGSGGLLHLPGGVVALCRGEKFSLEKEDRAPETVALLPGVTRWGGYTVFLEKSEHPVSGGNALVLDADKITGGLTLGPCRPGDGLYLPGGRGRRSGKRLCRDRGLDPVERDRLPAVYAGGRLAAVWPLGTDREFLPRETGGMRIIITIERETSGGQNDG